MSGARRELECVECRYATELRGDGVRTVSDSSAENRGARAQTHKDDGGDGARMADEVSNDSRTRQSGGTSSMFLQEGIVYMKLV